MAYTLTVRERGNSWAGRSPVKSVHATHEAAEAELLNYVRRNWNSEIGTEQPADPQAMINEYFEDVLEAFEISERTGALQRA